MWQHSLLTRVHWAVLCCAVLCPAGKDRSMLIPNVLFRCNGSAVLLTNKAKHVKRAKYSIPHIVRTNLASNDVAFNCVMQTEDAERKLGVRLNKDLIKVGPA
jgi:3-ketoacyl-CoA synthase